MFETEHEGSSRRCARRDGDIHPGQSVCSSLRIRTSSRRALRSKKSMAANKQALSHYTWQEQQTVSLKGEVKKQQLFQVQNGPDGKPQKTLVGPPPEQQAPSGGELKRQVVEKKKEEFKDYAQQIAELAQSYAQPEPGRLQQAFAQGNAMLGSVGVPGEIKLVIHNYVKPKRYRNDDVQQRRQSYAESADRFLA